MATDICTSNDGKNFFAKGCKEMRKNICCNGGDGDALCMDWRGWRDDDDNYYYYYRY